MKLTSKKVALLSPNKSTYSETFIVAHREKLEGDIYFYHDGAIPKELAGHKNPDKIELTDQEKDISLGNSEIRSLIQLKKSFKQNKIDVVLAEYGVTAAQSLPAIIDAGLPLVVHFHGYDAYENDLLARFETNYNSLFSYAAQVIAVSNAMKKQLVSIGCPEDKIKVIPCGPRQDFFELKPTFKNFQFFAAGRFVPKKAPYYTILAFKKVIESEPKAILKMAADGPYLEACKSIVKDSGLQDSVIFLGPISHKKLKKEMEDSFAFVQHSVTALNGDSEGTPVAVMEAGAAGIPVIATRHAGINDVVIQDKTGLLVNEHDMYGMAEAMISLIKDPKKAKQMGDKARSLMADKFALDKNIKHIDKAIDYAIESKGKPSKQKISAISKLASSKESIQRKVFQQKALRLESINLEKERNIQKLSKEVGRVKHLEAEVASLKTSPSYKIGSIITLLFTKPWVIPPRIYSRFRQSFK